MINETARPYQNHLRMFCEYITDPRYGWMSVCQERFGEVPLQILHEWNTVTHVSEYEGDPRRPEGRICYTCYHSDPQERPN